MIKNVFFIAIFLIAGATSLRAQNLTPEQYIALYKDIAIKEMRRMGVPAAITLAQGLLETESGNSSLVKKSNNHFGIKCKSTWTAGSVSHDDDAPGECFRTYKDAEASYRDHSIFLRGSDRYAFLFDLDPIDYKGWARGLKKAGYATNPKYPDILIRHIEQYNLQQYSVEGARGMNKYDSDKFENDKELPVVKAQPEVPAEALPSTPSDRILYINGSKCIFAKAGTSLLAIATNNDVNLNKLLDYNDLEEDGLLEADQVIFLQRKGKTGDKDYYMVTGEETLHDVSQKNGIQLEYLLNYNKLEEDAPVKNGTRLFLKPIAESYQASVVKQDAANAVVATPAVSNSAKVKLHEVQPKEGLYAISRKYGVTVQQLRDWNQLPSDDLKIGQSLIVAQ